MFVPCFVQCHDRCRRTSDFGCSLYVAHVVKPRHGHLLEVGPALYHTQNPTNTTTLPTNTDPCLTKPHLVQVNPLRWLYYPNFLKSQIP